MANALGGRSVALGPGLPGRLNPLDAAPRPESISEADWVGGIRKRRLLLLGSLARTVLSRDLMPMEHTALWTSPSTPSSPAPPTPAIPRSSATSPPPSTTPVRSTRAPE